MEVKDIILIIAIIALAGLSYYFYSNLMLAKDGVDQLMAGIGECQAGVAQLTAGLGECQAGVEQLQAGLTECVAGATQCQAGLIELQTVCAPFLPTQ